MKMVKKDVNANNFLNLIILFSWFIAGCSSVGERTEVFARHGSGTWRIEHEEGQTIKSQEINGIIVTRLYYSDDLLTKQEAFRLSDGTLHFVSTKKGYMQETIGHLSNGGKTVVLYDTKKRAEYHIRNSTKMEI